MTTTNIANNQMEIPLTLTHDSPSLAVLAFIVLYIFFSLKLLLLLLLSCYELLGSLSLSLSLPRYRLGVENWDMLEESSSSNNDRKPENLCTSLDPQGRQQQTVRNTPWLITTGVARLFLPLMHDNDWTLTYSINWTSSSQVRCTKKLLNN